jgi:hypothetical protein
VTVVWPQKVAKVVGAALFGVPGEAGVGEVIPGTSGLPGLAWPVAVTKSTVAGACDMTVAGGIDIAMVVGVAGVGIFDVPKADVGDATVGACVGGLTLAGDTEGGNCVAGDAPAPVGELGVVSSLAIGYGDGLGVGAGGLSSSISGVENSVGTGVGPVWIGLGELCAAACACGSYSSTVRDRSSMADP